MGPPLAAPTSENRTENLVRQTLLTVFFISLSLPVAIQQTALALLLAFVAYLGWWNKGFSQTPLDRPILGFFAALVVSALFCPAVISSLVGMRRLWLVGACFGVYYCLATPREAWRLSGLAVCVAALVAVFGIVQYYTGFDLPHWLKGEKQAVYQFSYEQGARFRAEGLFPTGITYAHNLLFPLTLVTVWLLAPRVAWPTRLRLGLGWLVMMFALVFTLTRGVWIAYLAILLLLGMIRGGRVVLTIGACLTLIGLVLTLSNPLLQERVKYGFELKENTGRIVVWQANIDMIKERPLLGWGYGNYKQFRDEFYRRYPVDTTAHAHNTYLQIWVAGGVVGLAAFLFLFWSILKLGWRTYRRLPEEEGHLRILALGVFLSILGFLIGGLTQYNFGDAEVVLVMWAMVGVLMRVHEWATEAMNSETMT